ncbi:MAG TPA: hypothetical protein VFG04_20455 [Planctomycetaceae bacterium]|jgi:hypothetical protein|nr:hypothetical protein [Planctomycetaceae bacterium]
MLQFFISIGSPTQLAVSPVAATAHVLPVRTEKPSTVAAVPATASVFAPSSAASINQVTMNPVGAHAFVEVPSRRVATTRTNAVRAHANLFAQHLHNATHANRIAAHGRTLTVAYAGPVFLGAKIGFLTVRPTRSAIKFTAVPTRQGTLTVQ